MTATIEPGKIILLHGATSAGKSTLARGLQAALDEPFWHVSIDHLRDSGMLPIERIRRGDFAWTAMREPFFAAFHQWLPVLAVTGNNLIVEHIIESQAWMESLVRLLEPFDVFLVGVHCDLAELERREVARGDRPIGGARQDIAHIHRYIRYDLEIDTTEPNPELVTTIIRAWQRRFGKAENRAAPTDQKVGIRRAAQNRYDSGNTES